MIFGVLTASALVLNLRVLVFLHLVVPIVCVDAVQPAAHNLAMLMLGEREGRERGGGERKERGRGSTQRAVTNIVVFREAVTSFHG
jgi:hypothetical protein